MSLNTITFPETRTEIVGFHSLHKIVRRGFHRGYRRMSGAFQTAPFVVIDVKHVAPTGLRAFA